MCKYPKNIRTILYSFPSNQVFHAFNSLLIGIYVAVVHVLNSLAPGLVPTSSLWLVTYVASSHIGYVPQCRVNGEFILNLLLSSPMPFSIHRTIIITNTLIKQTGSYYVITDFDRIWDISQLYPVYSDDIVVITLNLSSALVSCNNNDIIPVPGYNYNISYTARKSLKLHF